MSEECRRVLEATGPLPEDLARHAKTCAPCQTTLKLREALGSLSASQGAPSPSSSLRAELAAHPRPHRAWVAPVVSAGLNAAAAGFGLYLWSAGGLVHNRAAPALLSGLASALGLIVLGAPAIALMPVRGRLLRWWAFCALGMGLALIPCGSGLAVPGPFSAGMACLVSELGLSVLPCAVAVYLLTRSSYAPTKAWTASAAAGMTGLFALHLHCPDGSAAHLAVFHVFPWLLLTTVAVWVRRALPSWSHAP